MTQDDLTPPKLVTDPSTTEFNIHTNPIAMMAWMSNWVMLILLLPSLSVIVFLRHKFGCRFMKLWMVLVSAIVLWTFYSFDAFSLKITPARVFAVAMVVLAVHHSRDAWKRFWDAESDPRLLWHSLNDGLPRLRAFFPNASERVLKVVIEPSVAAGMALLCFLIALPGQPGLFRIRFTGLGLWLLTAAISHALYESMLYEQRLHAFIDMVDGSVEVTSMMESRFAFTHGRTKPLTAEESMGNPVIFAPKLFNVMKEARKRAAQATAAAAPAGD